MRGAVTALDLTQLSNALWSLVHLGYSSSYMADLTAEIFRLAGDFGDWGGD
jgi:hypothetical protein